MRDLSGRCFGYSEGPRQKPHGSRVPHTFKRDGITEDPQVAVTLPSPSTLPARRKFVTGRLALAQTRSSEPGREPHIATRRSSGLRPALRVRRRGRKTMRAICRWPPQEQGLTTGIGPWAIPCSEETPQRSQQMTATLGMTDPPWSGGWKRGRSGWGHGTPLEVDTLTRTRR